MGFDSGITPTDARPLISSLSNEPDMAELIELFATELPSRVRTIVDSVEAEDLNRLHTCAHQLKGSAGGYGFEPISAAAARLEQAIRQQTEGPDLAAVVREADALIALCRRVSLSK